MKARSRQDVRAEARQIRGWTEDDEARLADIRAAMAAGERAYRLKCLCETYGLNQADVAGELGISQSRVSRIERGDLDHTELGR